MKRQRKQQCNIELRSEKVRSIVGAPPSSLIRHGTVIITFTLFCMFSITYLLPYKQIYLGTAIIYEIPNEYHSDNIEEIVLLKFREKKPDSRIQEGYISFLSNTGTVNGTLLRLSSVCDTLGRQEALCCIPQQAMKMMENSEVNFLLTVPSGNLLKLFISTSFQK